MKKEASFVNLFVEILPEAQEVYKGSLLSEYLNKDDHYPEPGAGELVNADHAGIDLMTIEDIVIDPGEVALLSLGVIVTVQQPGFHLLAIPRSSTFLKWGLLQANSCGLIDQNYHGPTDVIKFPAFNPGKVPRLLPKGTRVCQLIIQQTIPVLMCKPLVDKARSRGGFGSTGD